MTFDRAEIEVLALCAWCRDLPVHGCKNIPAEIIEVLLERKLIRQSKNGLGYRCTPEAFELLHRAEMEFTQDKTYRTNSDALTRRMQMAEITSFFWRYGADVFENSPPAKTDKNLFLPSFVFRRQKHSNILGATNLTGFYYAENTVFVPYYIARENNGVYPDVEQRTFRSELLLSGRRPHIIYTGDGDLDKIIETVSYKKERSKKSTTFYYKDAIDRFNCPVALMPLTEDGNSQHWIIDEEAAYVVRRIFDMSYSGMGTFQIALTLSDEKILTPTEYAARKGIKKAGGNTGKTTTDPYRWGQSTVGKILANQEYCGDVINFKTYSISYKNKKRHANDPENILVFKEVHEPIIDRTIFETIQLRRGKTRKRPMSNGEKNMFSGLLVCSDCGRNLHYHLNNRNIRFFSCPGYNQGRRKDCTSTHYVRVDFLEQVVLAEIRRLTRFACKYEDEFVRVVSQFSKQAMQSQIDVYQSEIKSLILRDKELDRIFERLYEDNLSGKITDERFKKMSVNYDVEQKDLRERLNRLNDILEELACKTNSTEKFIKAVKKYTRVKKLTASMVIELIEHIEVHHTEKIDGVKTQKLVIYYNCIGSINIPEDVSIPEVDITMKTRKGVELTYVPDAAPAASAV